MVQEYTVTDHATPEQVSFFRDQGYLKFDRIFTREEMDALRERVDAMIAALPEGARPEAMDIPHIKDPWLFKYLAHPRVLDVIEAFIGPNIVLWSSHFIAKPRGDGKAVPWHTDGAYWGDRLKPMEVITLWLAVDESTVENGCMRVLPGSHKAAVGMDQYVPVDHQANVFGAEVKQELIDESQAVDLELRVGECHFHDAWTLHSSCPNTSEKRRCGYTMRYMPSYAVYLRDHWSDETGHQIYLLRGEDLSEGRNRYASLPDDSSNGTKL
jgi:chlorinating enzyme